MTWYATARYLGRAAPVVVVVCVLTVIWSGVPLPVPNLGGGVTLGVPAALLLPSCAALAVVAAFVGSGDHVERSATRPLTLLDRATCVLLVLLGVAVLLVAGVCTREPLLVAGAHNLVGFTGVGLVARRVLGPRAAPSAPVVVALLTGVFGQANDPSIWFWPLREPVDVAAPVLAVAWFVAGLALGLGRSAGRPGVVTA